MKRLLTLFFMIGCSALSVFSPQPITPTIRPIQYLPGSSFDPTIINGLSNVDRSIYYHMDEGIQYLPTNVFLALKRSAPSSILKVEDELFFAHPERFGLLPDYTNPNNPLPIGITQSTDTDYVPMTGIDCACCNMGMVSNSKGQFFLVDGAPSRFSINSFLGEMVKSVVGTLANPVEFEAFYQRYMALSAIPDTQEPLSADATSTHPLVAEVINTHDLTKLTAQSSKVAAKTSALLTHRLTSLQDDAYPTAAQLSTRTGMYFYLVHRFLWFYGMTKYGTNSVPDMSDAGLGRSDPWTPTKKMLMDKLLHQDIGQIKTATVVRTPFIWGLARQHWIFLQGQTNSLVERNLIQAVALWSSFNTTTYETTASIRKLQAIIEYAKKITPPTWPESILGSLDASLVAKGKDIFKSKCLECHNPQLSSTTTASANYNYVNVDTETTYYSTQVELLNGKNLFTDVVAPFMTRVKQAAMQNEGLNAIDMQNTYEVGRLPVVWKSAISNSFGAKPLFGIWMIGPFLHNGSIKSLYELLLPAIQRSKSFLISSYVFDPKNLGYMEDSSLPVVDTFMLNTSCATCEGNSNGGHEFGSDLSDADRYALLEFLKYYTPNTLFIELSYAH